MKLTYQTQLNEAKLGYIDDWPQLSKRLRFDLDKLRLEMLSVTYFSVTISYEILTHMFRKLSKNAKPAEH